MTPRTNKDNISISMGRTQEYLALKTRILLRLLMSDILMKNIPN